jgi:two-component system sensor histidine kinase KdpD
MADQRSDLEHRPSPEALLAEARREETRRTGRLKIFVGAAPGVGKTYEMLQAARAKLKEGVDVVVGVVETHGRRETEALLEGLEVLPRKPTVYVNRILSEFDIDAALKRRPGLILVDELAHTNIPGSRHPKRYQDVEELLDAGIDVYTTVNIQHIESLNDVVAQITRVRVREVVPDAILDRAEAIKLVDLTPDELIQRLKEGKVYVPKQAERALKHYFSPANLTALRELALRRTAERVDEQLLEQMQARAISGPWTHARRASCATQSALPIACMRPGLPSTSRHSAACSSARTSGTGSPTPCGWRSDSREKRSPCPPRSAGSPTTYSNMPTRTTQPTSSSASPRVPGGSRSCMGRSCTTWCGAPATSVFT